MNFLKKSFAGFMMLSLSLSVGGLGTIFLTTNVAYAVVAAPSVTVLSGPINPTNQTSATFTFSATPSGATFECRNGTVGSYGNCTSPKTYTGLTSGNHTFMVRATNSSGTGSATSYPWTIDTTPPTIIITSPSSGGTTGSTGTIIYSTGDASTVSCTLDSHEVACAVSGTYAFSGLSGAQHTFAVIGTDAAGNSTSTSVTWVVDIPPPAITVIKHVVGGTQLASFFDIFVRMVNEPFTAVATIHGNEDGTTVSVNPGSYNIQEDGYANYNTTYSGVCNPRGLVAGSRATCTVTNTFVPPPATLVVNKVVIGGTKIITDFVLKVCPTTAPNNFALLESIGLVGVANATVVEDNCITVTSGTVNTLTPGWYQVSEVNPTDWHYTMNRTAGDCDADGKVQLGAGNAKSCEMTNTYVPPPVCSEGTTGVWPVCIPIPPPTPTPAPVCNPDTNLLQNAGFEAPIVSSWDIIPFTNTALKWLGAWVTPHSDEVPFGLELQASAAGTPAEGRQLAELDGYHPTTIWQDIPTIPGNDYTLNVKFSARPGTSIADNVLQVLAGGVQLGAQESRAGTGVTVWTPVTRTFTATSTVTRVQFADLGGDNSLGSYLDDSSLYCVGKHVDNGHLIIVKHSVGGNGEFNFTLNHGEDATINASVETEEGSGETKPIDVTANTNYTIDEPTVPEGWNFTSVSCKYDDESIGNIVESHPTQHVISVAPGETVTCTYTNTKIVVDEGPSCQIEGYKYDAEGHTVAGLIVGAMTKPLMETVRNNECDGEECDNEGTHQEVESRGKIVVTKTDKTGHYCINGLRGGSARVFEWPANGTEIDHMTDGEENIQPRINSFFDIFTEVSLHMDTPHQPAQMDSFFDVFTEINGGETNRIHSFFDVFTELSIDGGMQPASSFFDVFTEVSLDGGRTVNFYNRPIPITLTPPTGGGGSSSFDYYGCTDATATNFNPLANKDDGSCNKKEDNHEGNGNGGNGGHENSNGNVGEVLGASTTVPELPLPPSCAANPYLRDYLKMGKKNDPEQVKLLQTLLNENMGSHLPISGIFGNMTRRVVKEFQKKHHAEIIKPWIDAGYKGKDIESGTGYVYKTTKRAINMIKCTGFIEPLPDLTPDLGN